MRIKLGMTLMAAVLTTLVALPGTARAASFTMTKTPTGGPNGTRITLSGTCDADNKVSVLLTNKDSDALSVFASGTFDAGPGGTWRGTITVATPGGAPDLRDLNLIGTCGTITDTQPFFVTPSTTSTAPTVLTALSQDGCAVAFSAEFEYIPCPPHVKGFANGTLTKTNFYTENTRGGASVAVGNVDGSGAQEIIVGSGPGHSPQVWVTALDGTPITSFMPYDANFKGGVNVAAADVDGDGKAEIITGAGSGGGPHVRIFNGSGQAVGGFFAYDPAFHGGVNVAAADLNGDGKAEIVTGAGPGGGPHVRIFSGSGAPVGGGFFAYDPRFVGGVSVAAAANRIVTGAGRGGGPHVRVFDGAGTPSGSGFFAYDGAFFGGVWVGLSGTTIVTGPGSGGGPDVRTFNLSGTKTDEFLAYEPAFTAGVKVAMVGASSGGTSSSSGPGGTTVSNPGGGGTTISLPGGSTTSSG